MSVNHLVASAVTVAQLENFELEPQPSRLPPTSSQEWYQVDLAPPMMVPLLAQASITSLRTFSSLAQTILLTSLNEFFS